MSTCSHIPVHLIKVTHFYFCHNVAPEHTAQHDLIFTSQYSLSLHHNTAFYYITIQPFITSQYSLLLRHNTAFYYITIQPFITSQYSHLLHHNTAFYYITIQLYITSQYSFILHYSTSFRTENFILYSHYITKCQ